MKWNRIVLAAVIGGIVMWLASFVLHGLVMGGTYVKYPEVFTQEEGNPLVIEGFPYYMGWCWGGINMLVALCLGAALGGLIKKA